MKKFSFLIILFSTFMQAQTYFPTYSEQWKEVEKLETENLTKSANEKVEQIYQSAKKDQNSPQIVKSLLYLSKYAMVLDENEQLNIVKRFESEIATATFPTKNLLESILANLYWQYFQQNRWRFYNRTETSEKVNPEDFRTWDLNTIFAEIQQHFDHSLQSETQLQSTDLKPFEAVLITGADNQKYRPTFYDFMAHQALDFYETDEKNLTKPAYKFELDQPDYLSDYKTFATLALTTQDTLSNAFKALQLYQNLTRFHQKDAKPDALIQSDLERLHFVNKHATFSDKEGVLLATLIQSKNQFLFEESGTLYDYEIAQHYQNQGNSYNPQTNPNPQFLLQKAVEVCSDAGKRFPQSYGAKKCENLKAGILHPELSLKTEEYLPENTPAFIHVRYKNTANLDFKILKINDEQEKKLQELHNDAVRPAFINELQLVKNETVTLKNVGDYQFHTTEVLLPALNQGKYLVLAQVPQTETYGYAIVQITDLVLTEIGNAQEQRLQLVHRITGKPLQVAKVHLKSIYNNRYDKSYDKTFTTDANGFIYLPKDNYYNNLRAKVTYGNQTATFGNYNISQAYKDNTNLKTYHQVSVFTDRSIYRPGQKVYFKAIVIENKPVGKKTISTVMPNMKVEAVLKDVNWQEVAKLDLTTNAFGSVAGEFVLPESGLTGIHHLQINAVKGNIGGSADFSVEEYKRPKFEAEFNPITETYKVNDTVKITGKALAYAGTNISDAQVVYRVHRKVQYPRWWYWHKPYFRSEPQEITHGETLTDATGAFQIAFAALPDQSVAAQSLPIFQYEIEADITDINGETHSAKTIVNVGYQSMTADLVVDAKWDASQVQQNIKIVTQNLNGEKVPSKGSVKIYKMQAPKEAKRKRTWEAPDFPQWTENEFNKLFPHDYYTNDNNQKLGEKIFETDYDTTNGEAEIVFKNEYKKWLGGAYQIVLETKDKTGTEITEKANFDLVQPQAKEVADEQLFVAYLDKAAYVPADKAVLTVGTASPDAYFYVYVEKDRKIVQTLPILLKNGIKKIEFPIAETDVSGFSIVVTMVNFNSFNSQSLPVNVKEKSEDLSIETLTFRDKMQPGSEQTWSFKVKGLQKDLKTAEILASMYDASLDQFKSHQWDVPQKPQTSYWSSLTAQAYTSFDQRGFYLYGLPQHHYLEITERYFDQLNWFGFGFGNNADDYLMRDKSVRPMMAMKKGENREVVMDAMKLEESVAAPAMDQQAGLVGNVENKAKEEAVKPDFSDVKIRTNFNETAFFYPQIQTDAAGDFTFSFTSPEALTRWKLQLLGHTTDMQTAYHSATSVTQKELMLTPNAPRFLREGDQIIFSTKISNLSEKTLQGVAQLELTDAVSGKNIDVNLGNIETQKSFMVDAKGNAQVSWTLQIPFDIQAVQYKVVAKAGDFSDGEQNVLPVLSNRMLVTETLPMWINSNETKTFTLDKLKNNTSTSLQNYKLTLEVTSNPVWYAIQALPYLMEYPYECSEQTFSRYYANALATKIVKDNPKIEAVFRQWENADVLMSNLEKNEELKSLLIAETPWLREAQSETEQQKRIALLFDFKKMSRELEKSAQKLYDMQFSDGGFPWFKGSRYPDRYITQYIAAGFGHLEKLGVFPLRSKSILTYDESKKTKEMLVKAVQFLDAKIIEDYEYLEKQAKIKLETPKSVKEGQKAAEEYWKDNHLGALQLHYLYTRTFYNELPKSVRLQKVIAYYTGQAEQYWKDYSLYQKGLIALILNRSGKQDLAKNIVKSLDENSITNPEMGMYWKENTSSWYWYQAPIETQALMIETFAEINPVQSQLDLLKVWLLKNKQTNRWETTKSTTEAIFGLLAYGTDWTASEELVDVKVGNKMIVPTQTQAGSGYFKTSWNGNNLNPEQAIVTLTKKDEGIAWGGLYWQYFENLDKITFAETPLQLSKKLFLKQNTDTGEKLFEIKDSTQVKVGDLVRVRIELKVDRPMEFVHIKDMRASGFEPENVLSQYKYQDGLGYYENTKDSATNFFFDQLQKGVYVFEYDLRANNAGDFSNGITTIQCMYAPEFTSHSEGVRVSIILNDIDP